MTADPHNSDQDTVNDPSPETASAQSTESESPKPSDHSSRSRSQGSTETSTVSAGPSRSSGGKGVAWLALLLSLGSASWLAWQWWQGDGSEQTPALDAAQIRSLIESDLLRLEADQTSALSQRDQAIDSATAELSRLNAQINTLAQRDDSAMDTRISNLDRRLDGQQQSTDQQLNRLSERLQRLASAYASITQQLTGSDHLDLTLAEVASQLNLANNYLLIQADSSVARSLIAQAQRQLNSQDEPLLSALRQELARASQALDQVIEPDLSALSAAIRGLYEESSTWPMLSERRARNDEHNQVRPDGEDDGYWSRFKQTLSGLVVIRRDQAGDAVLLSLREEELLRENTRLQLQVAQLAAVRRDQALFDQSLNQVSQWMDRYHDVDAESLQSARTRLDELRGTILQPELPDLSAALTELNRARTALQTLDQVPASLPATEPVTDS